MSEEISLNEIEKLESYYFDLIKSSLGETAALKRELESQNKLMKQFLSPLDRVAVETNTKSYFDQVKIQDKNLLFFEEGNQKPFLNSHQKFD